MKKFKIKQKSNRFGFTLVELVIVIAIVIILSVISVPIYRGYVDKSKWAEAYALFGTILSAQKAYYSEYGNFLSFKSADPWRTSFHPILGIDARGNKYFTLFRVASAGSDDKPTTSFFGEIIIPAELRRIEGKSCLCFRYDIANAGEPYNFFREDFY